MQYIRIYTFIRFKCKIPKWPKHRWWSHRGSHEIGHPQISSHDDVIKWKHFPRNWPFVRGVHRSPVNSPHKGQWRGALMFSLICVWILSKQSWGWWFETLSRPLWRHCNMRAPDPHISGRIKTPTETENCLDANSVVTRATGGCWYDNLRSLQWRQRWHQYNFRFLVPSTPITTWIWQPRADLRVRILFVSVVYNLFEYRIPQNHIECST